MLGALVRQKLLATGLPPDAYGLYGLLQSAVGAGTSLHAVAVGSHFVPILSAPSGKQAALTAVASICLAQMVVVAAMLPISLAAIYFAATATTIQAITESFWPFIVVAFIFAVPASLAGVWICALARSRAYPAMMTLIALVQTIVVAFLIASPRSGNIPGKLLVGVNAAALLVSLAIVARPLLRLAWKRTFDALPIGKVLAVGLPFAIGSFCSATAWYALRVRAGQLAGMDALGILNGAIALAQQGGQVCLVFLSTAALRSLSEELAPHAARIRVQVLVAAFVVAYVVIGVALSETLIRIFLSASFITGVGAFRIVLLAEGIRMVCWSVAIAEQATGRVLMPAFLDAAAIVIAAGLAFGARAEDGEIEVFATCLLLGWTVVGVGMVGWYLAKNRMEK